MITNNCFHADFSRLRQPVHKRETERLFKGENKSMSESEAARLAGGTL